MLETTALHIINAMNIITTANGFDLADASVSASDVTVNVLTNIRAVLEKEKPVLSDGLFFCLSTPNTNLQ